MLTYEPMHSHSRTHQALRGCRAEIIEPGARSVIFPDDRMYRVRISAPGRDLIVNAYGAELLVVAETQTQGAAA